MDHDLTLLPADGPADIAAVRALFRAYAESLGVSLDFQGFDAELAALPGKYVPPGGALLLARQQREAAGVVAIRPLAPGIAEMKRLYVAPEARGTGLGRRLAIAAIEAARAAGHQALRLDTLATMSAAQGLYRDLGFYEIASYYDNPLAGTRYFELSLTG